MKGPTRELWMQLCEQAAVEQDPNRLLDLVKQINTLLEQKERRLCAEQSPRDRNDANPNASR